MKCSLTIICDDSLATGFELAGIRAIGVTDAKSVQEKVQEQLTSTQWNVVVLDSELEGRLSDHIKERMQESQMPLFVVIPIRAHTREDGDRVDIRKFVERLIQDAIGKKIVIPV
ncbi:hypothetical protein BVY04_02690 [bacterium M21]|nr:hypothetical protein BVY04_02690 [bacterium M21]